MISIGKLPVRSDSPPGNVCDACRDSAVYFVVIGNGATGLHPIRFLVCRPCLDDLLTVTAKMSTRSDLSSASLGREIRP